jgi:hypothetical protein
MRVLNMKVKVLESICQMSEMWILYGVEIWGVKIGWVITDEIQGQFYKKHIRSPRRTANAAAEWDLVEKERQNALKYSKILV